MKSLTFILVVLVLFLQITPASLLAQGEKTAKAITLTEEPQQVSDEPKNQAGPKTFAYKIKSDLYDNKELVVYYRIWLDATGRPGPQADNVIFQAPYTNLGTNGKYFDTSYQRKLTDQYGYTVFSLVVKGSLTYVEDRVKCHYYPESGSFDLAFKIQDFLRQKYNLSSKKLIVAGESGGSAMAELMGVHDSDRIDVVAFPGGRFFESPKPDSKIAWFGLNTWGDIPERRSSYSTLKSQMDGMGLQLLYCQTPPEWKEVTSGNFHHILGPLAEELLVEYIHATIELRNQNKLFPASGWPVQIDDGGKKLFMPSQHFLELWKNVPHEAVKLVETGTSTPDNPITIFPTTNDLKGVVLFFHDDIFEPDVQLLDNLQYFADNGFVAFSLDTSDDPDENLKKIDQLITHIEGESRFNDLPIYLSGSGYGGQLSLVTAFHSHSTRIKAVATISSHPNWTFDETPPELAVRSSRLPILLIYGENDFKLTTRNYNLAKMQKAAPGGSRQVMIKVIPHGDENLGKDWFNSLDDICAFFSQQK